MLVGIDYLYCEVGRLDSLQVKCCTGAFIPTEILMTCITISKSTCVH